MAAREGFVTNSNQQSVPRLDSCCNFETIGNAVISECYPHS